MRGRRAGPLRSVRLLARWLAGYATAPLRTLPDFLVIGAQRSGTTSFFRHLTDHPAVPPVFKELHFFDLSFHRGLSFYRAFFPTTLSRALHRRWYGVPLRAGEATPYYLFHPHAARRVHAALPDVRLIVLLRNPVDRAYSHYQHEVFRGREGLSFEEAVAREEERLRGETERMLADETYASVPHRSYSYLARGRYAEQLQVWFRYFPRDHFLIIKSEEYFRDPAALLAQAWVFLQLPAARFSKVPEQSPATYPPMDPAIRRRLMAYFAPYNQRLTALLGPEFTWDA